MQKWVVTEIHFAWVFAICNKDGIWDDLNYILSRLLWLLWFFNFHEKFSLFRRVGIMQDFELDEKNDECGCLNVINSQKSHVNCRFVWLFSRKLYCNYPNYKYKGSPQRCLVVRAKIDYLINPQKINPNLSRKPFLSHRFWSKKYIVIYSVCKNDFTDCLCWEN